MSKDVGGRPTIFTQELADSILNAYSEGFSLREICSMDNMPDRVTIWRWRQQNEAFATAYARASQANSESIEDEMADIERQVLAGELEPQAANVVLASQRWRARVLHPQRHSEKVDVSHSGKVGLSININLDKEKGE